ncbi:MAG: NAD(P)H-dependent oxidoreductase [Rhodobacter sp.]|nr:NAD(P)H-dependent oxidoreductase [Paracoccaceae bacterium]MCC0080519.1 NAD(P)H-dependent oxidoreductase [Rhodobacter sp.]
MTILALAASSRENSLNAALLDVILDELAPAGFAVDRVDYTLFEETPHYSARSEQTEGVPQPMRDLAARIQAADGLILITPEYNHAIPGTLKNGIDWLSRVSVTLMAMKPTLIGGASAAPYGAWRAIRSLRPSVELLGALTLPYMISMSGVTSKADITARFGDPLARAKIDPALAGFRDLVALRQGKGSA